jgi:hypothetical protein
LPVSFNLLAPPEPPPEEELDGGTSGMIRVRSTPESIVVTVISFRRGTGERLGLSIAQLSDMAIMVVVVVEEKEDGRTGHRNSLDDK